VVESQPSKLLVAGSIPVSRSIRRRAPEKQARSGAMPRRSAEGAQAGSLRSQGSRASYAWHAILTKAVALQARSTSLDIRDRHVRSSVGEGLPAEARHSVPTSEGGPM
jgi:hypothetical protein